MAAVEKGARSRILHAAADLFYKQGITATGVDSIIERARVAKATFYYQFPSKDALVLAWLQMPETRWHVRFRDQLEARNIPASKRLVGFFDLLKPWFEEDGFRGCPYINAAAEVPDPDHPVRRAFRDMTVELQGFFQADAREAGLKEPAAVASQLFFLVAGSITDAVARRNSDPARIARGAATRLISRATPA